MCSENNNFYCAYPLTNETFSKSRAITEYHRPHYYNYNRYWADTLKPTSEMEIFHIINCLFSNFRLYIFGIMTIPIKFLLSNIYYINILNFTRYFTHQHFTNWITQKKTASWVYKGKIKWFIPIHYPRYQSRCRFLKREKKTVYNGPQVKIILIKSKGMVFQRNLDLKSLTNSPH